MTTTAIGADPVNDLTLEESEVSFYHQQGYLPLPGFLDAAALPDLREEVLDILQQVHGLDRAALAQASETADKLRQCSTYLKDSLLDRMINSPRTLAIASRLIGGEAQRYMPFTAVKAGRGGGEFHLHQDNNYTRHEPATGSINIWVALVDMSPENGCLRLAPGSHLGGQSQDMTSPDGDHRTVVTAPDLVVPMRMRAGDAVAFTRWTIHGSGPNRQPDPRIAYALQYHREDVQYLDKADDTWKSLRTNPRWSTEPLAAFGGEA